MPPSEPIEPTQPAGDPAPADPWWRRLDRTKLAWGGFGLILVLLVGYLVLPTLHYGANLSPPGPAAWDQPQAVAKPRLAATPAPVRAEPAAAPAPDTAAEAAGNEDDSADDNSATDTAPAAPTDEDEMLRAIDRARVRALDSGKPKHWEAGGREGYVAPSQPTLDGEQECRNVVATVITESGQPRSSTERYCRADDDAEWVRR